MLFSGRLASRRASCCALCSLVKPAYVPFTSETRGFEDRRAVEGPESSRRVTCMSGKSRLSQVLEVENRAEEDEAPAPGSKLKRQRSVAYGGRPAGFQPPAPLLWFSYQGPATCQRGRPAGFQPPCRWGKTAGFGWIDWVTVGLFGSLWWFCSFDVFLVSCSGCKQAD